mgnify:CR=1 FL=1
MLDNETKRRIDTCRDILVGKVPDPKSQVEQITIGLIYKFMDDMDAEAEELGGLPSFFVGEYDRFGWRKIFNPALGGHEMLSLYSEAITRLALNPNLPQLFRDIFKNAYLPYRDPETLKSFLKELDWFSYDHSEKLGDAFEYLLSVLGSQGDAGQFRTPRHIIDFIVALLDPKKNETIMDPACGTAGFLISAYKHILAKNSVGGESKLTPDERTRLTANIKGYDISPDMVRLSLVNLYLHGFAEPHIFEYDSLSSEDRWNEYADVFLANPPFMSPKGGIKPHKRFSVESNRSEVLFVDYMVEHLTPNGRAAIIVPEGIIFQSGIAYKALRKMLVDNQYLVGVISLPAGVFQPYSGVKTSILWIDRTIAKRTDKILFAKIEADGFDLGAQRKASRKNDMPDLLESLKEYIASVGTLDETDLQASKPTVSMVSKVDIGKNGDYSLSGERYVIGTLASSSFPMIKISELSSFISKGTTPTSIGYQFEEEGINFVKIESITASGGFIKSKFAFINTECNEKLSRSQLQKNDVLFSIAGAFGRAGIVDESILPANTNQALAIIRPLPAILPGYLFLILKSDFCLEIVEKQKVGVAQFNLSLKQVGDIEIPLPPLSIQQEIVAEIDGYQKIIDGARQVVENYKPRIDIDPEWEMVELGEVCEIRSGGTPKREVPEYWEGNIPWVGSAVCKDVDVYEAKEFITELGLKNSSAKIFEEGTILIALVGATIGKTGYLQFKSTTNQNVAGLNPKLKERLSSRYLFFACQSLYPKFIRLGDGKFRMATLGFIKEQKIPLPPIEIQLQIVSQIENQQSLVNANRELILIFEQKIKDRIAKVWEG